MVNINRELKRYAKEWGDWLFLVFRVLIGLLFALHGAQKFGWLGGDGVGLASLMGVAGVIELVAGVLIVVGLLTRWAALVSAVEMLVAYFMVHAPQGWNPLANNGELALLYFAAFLVLFHYGSKKWSIDSWL